MAVSNLVQPLLLLVLVAALTPPLGAYIARAMAGERTPLSPAIGPVERLVYRGLRLAPGRDRAGRPYARSLLAFSLASVALAVPAAAPPGVAAGESRRVRRGRPDLALQHRRLVRDQHQLAELLAASHHELPHPDGRAGGAELRLGRRRHGGRDRAGARIRPPESRDASATSGPTSSAARCTCCSRCRSWSRSCSCRAAWCRTSTAPATVRRSPVPTQTIARGPVAAQEAIKELGTNGGGFFNANSAHPFENPTRSPTCSSSGAPVIPFALTVPFGRMAGDARQGWAVFAAMACCCRGHRLGHLPAIRARTALPRPAGVDQAAGQHGGQGGALRRRRLAASSRRDHRHLDRRGQLDARLVSPPIGGAVPL